MKKRPPDGWLALTGPAPLDVTGLLRRASPALLVAGVWLLCHPFKGIVHDGVLYAAQALHRLYPGVYGRDIFFAFGSQDDFTLFSALFAPLVGLLGPMAAAILVVAIGQALWLSGAAALAMRLAPDRGAAFAGLALAVALPGTYGGWDVLKFAEGFATPRLLVEGLSLWSLWALSRNRIGLAAAFAAVGALLHPLVAAAAVCVGFLYLALGDRRWLLLGVVGAAALALAAALDIGPLGRLSQTMDAAWRSVVERRNGYLFPTQWHVKDWGWLAMAAAANLAGAALLTGWRRRLILSVLLTGLGGLILSLAGGDLLGNLLLIQIQPFRALWLLQLCAYFAAGLLFRQLWLLKEDGLALIAAIGFSWLLVLFMNALLGACMGAAALAFAVMRLRGGVKPMSAVLKTALFALAALQAVFLLGGRALFVIDRASLLPEGPDYWRAFGTVTVIDVVAVAVVAAAVLRLRPRIARMALPAIALLALAGGAIAWDRASMWPDLMSAGDRTPPFDAQLPPNAEVFWEGDVRGAWLLLRHPSYISFKQGAGIAFNRDLALTVARRTQVVKPLIGFDLLDTLRTSAPLLPPLGRDTLADVCRRDVALDAMVLSRHVDGAFAAQWDPPFLVYEEQAVTQGGGHPPVRAFYLYRCADLR